MSAGCLPSATCGLYLVTLMAIEATALAIALPILRRQLAADAAMPWWAWPAIVPLGLVGLVIGAIALTALLEAIEWLYVASHGCPRCGARRWSRGFTRGFGL